MLHEKLARDCYSPAHNPQLPAVKRITGREKQRLWAEFLTSLHMTQDEYDAAPDATERDGMTLEAIEAETAEAEAATERIKKINAQSARAEHARYQHKLVLQAARKLRDKGRVRPRKKDNRGPLMRVVEFRIEQPLEENNSDADV